VTNTALSKGSKKTISGSMPAIVTPMFEDGSLDFGALKTLLDWHVAEGTDGIVIVGTSGESPTVSVQEHCELIRVTVEHIAGRIPVIAGTGGNSTAEAIELTEFAKKVGADASLQVVPYYNKPTQEGMYAHFKKIAESVELPVILYNVPGRTVADLAGDTVVRLATVPGIIGIKDATGSLERGTLLIDALKRAGEIWGIELAAANNENVFTAAFSHIALMIKQQRLVATTLDGFANGQDGVDIIAVGLGLTHLAVDVVAGIGRSPNLDAALHVLFPKIAAPLPSGYHHVVLDPLGVEPHGFRAEEAHGADVGILAVTLSAQQLRGLAAEHWPKDDLDADGAGIRRNRQSPKK